MQITVNYVQGGLDVACPKCGASENQPCRFYDRFNKNKLGLLLHSERAAVAKIQNAKQTQIESSSRDLAKELTKVENKTDDHDLNINETIMAEFDFFSQTLSNEFEINLSFDRRLDLFKLLKKYQDQTGDYQFDPTHYQFIQAVRFFNPELLKEN